MHYYFSSNLTPVPSSSVSACFVLWFCLEMLKKTTSAKGLDTEARRARENVLTVIAKDTAVAFLQFLTLQYVG